MPPLRGGPSAERRRGPTRIDDAVAKVLKQLQAFPESALRARSRGRWSRMRCASVDPVARRAGSPSRSCDVPVELRKYTSARSHQYAVLRIAAARTAPVASPVEARTA